MVISQFRQTRKGHLLRVEAQVRWDESDRSPFDLFFETSLKFASALRPNSSAALLACYLPAWRAGEHQVLVEGPVCPVLNRNLKVAAGVLRSWYPEVPPPPTVISNQGFTTRKQTGRESVSMMSCGIDSLATLRWNKLQLPEDHPDAITGAIVGIPSETSGLAMLDAAEDSHGRLLAARRVAADLGVEMIAVASNVWSLVKSGYFYDYAWHSALLASIACLFDARFHKVFIASSYALGQLHAWGSHPLLDPYYSSSHFQVVHDGLEMSRTDKVALVADWPVGLDNIRVCQNDHTGAGNCGTCEKCIRTQLALLTVGRLEECTSFTNIDITSELVTTLWEYRMLADEYDLAWYEELFPLLEECGRSDLAGALERVLALFRSAASGPKPPTNVWLNLGQEV